jgi:uncharacterized protein
MKFSLFPKETIFYELLEQLTSHAEQTILLFQKLLESWHPSHPALQELKKIERDGDQIVHKIMVKLNQTFVTPIDREDIHHLAKTLDDIIDLIQALGARMALFKIDHITPELKEMASVLEKAIKVLGLAIPQVKELKDGERLFKLCIEIHTLENQGDQLFEKSLASLFIDTKDPIEIIKWKEIYDFIEEAIDTCEDVADIIWGIIVKYG